MPMYCKLFSSLYQGTLRGRSDEILVFTNLLAHCDSEGYVDKHWRAISEETGISEDRVKAAILALESPDSESRSPDEEGRRIIRIDDHRAWGWQVTNYIKYREIKNAEDRRVQNREAQRRWRQNHKKVSGVIMNKQHKPMQKEIVEGEETYFDRFWSIYPKKDAKKSCFAKWLKLSIEDHVKILEALQWQVELKQWKDGFAPNPLTYLNGERWNDVSNEPIVKFKPLAGPAEYEPRQIP